MKYQNYILIFILTNCLFLSEYVFAQQPLNQISIISFTVKNKLPADVSTWGSLPASILLVAQKLPQAQIQGIKLVLQIRQAGAKVCGNNPQASVAMDVFTVRNFSANELSAFLAQCPKLKPSNYSLCVQFFNIDNYPISREFCKEFMVEDMVQSYSAPQNISPTNEKKFDDSFFKMPVTFRWTPVLPKPKDPVMYKLRVWQLMQGQTGVQAMKANSTIVEKEISNINQAIVSNMITGPCKPPYLCDFVWNVQAIDKDGKSIGKNDGMSELFSFSIKQHEWEPIKMLIPENKKIFSMEEAINEIAFRWTAFIPKPNNPVVYRLRVWQLMQGQTGLQAMKNNKPLVSKYIENIEEAQIKNLLTGPCKPPYLCNFIWDAQALGADGNPLDDGKNKFNAFSIK
jgi:hypothetical protein